MQKLRKIIVRVLPIIAIMFCTSCSGQTTTQENKTNTNSNSNASVNTNTVVDRNKCKVTFIELGSVRCIPCQQMQPIMKSVEEKYGKQVKVVFHDVWTEAGAPYAKKYGIDAIPTQVFLDKNGKEYFRHTGFFPEEELVKILQQKGVK